MQTLERLIGSQSVYSAIERQIGLRSVDLLGASLIVLWLISPLGGQASLRLLTTKPRVVSLNSTVQYFPMEGYSQSYLISPNVASEAWPRFAPLYMTSLHLSRNYMNAPMDLWGAVKIPDPASSSGKLDDGWQSFEFAPSANYTSLFGIPTVGIPTTGNTTFNLMSHYWAVNCANFTLEKADWNSTSMFGMYRESAQSISFTMELPFNADDDLKDGVTFTYRSLRAEPPAANAPGGRNASISQTKCSLAIKFVESRVGCAGQSCRVTAMRNIDRGTIPFPTHLIRNALILLPGTDIGLLPSRRTRTQSEITEKWIADPDTTFDDDAGPEAVSGFFADVSKIPPPVFSKRLQLVINTFWDSTLGSRYRSANFTLGQNFSMFTTSSGISTPLHFNSSQLSGSKFDGEQYVCSKPFAIITIVVSMVLFVSAVVSLVLAASLTTSPDILGFISTYLRDNPYADAKAASHSDGLDAARVLGDIRVIVGDVKSGEDVGHVAFATVGNGVERLERKKLYD
jgi:hypothetical protein